MLSLTLADVKASCYNSSMLTIALPLPLRGLLQKLGLTLARGGQRPPPEPVVVYRAANQFEAEVVAGRLKAAGIPAWLRSESLGHTYGLTIGPLAEVDILVPAALAEQARALLADDDENGGDTDG